MYVQNSENARRVFFDDVRERKSIGRGGYHKKIGTKSRKCSLPSDHLTEKEWRKMNGPITTVNLNAPIAWGEFKMLSNDLKFQYIKMLSDRFNATKLGICDAFGISFGTLTSGIADLGVNELFYSGKKMKKVDRAALLSFFGREELCNGAASDDSANYECHNSQFDMCTSELCNDKSESKAEDKEDVDSHQSVANWFAMKTFEVSFQGSFDANHVANSLRHMVPAGTTVKLKITCELLG